MIHLFSERAEKAVDRYGYLLDILRAQADLAFRHGDAGVDDGREQAVSVSLEAARSFLSTEQALLNDDTVEVAKRAHSAAQRDLGVSDALIEDRWADYIFSAAAYTTQLIAAQASRDVMTMAQHIQRNAMRLDLYVRTGRHTRSSAAAAVIRENQEIPTFRFLDRAGRLFKATKHIRDIYRQHLLSVYNEVYMAVVADHGWEIVRVTHPDPSYKWHGVALAIVSLEGVDDYPLYYDVREEIFHPGSSATLTIDFLGDE